MIDSIFLTKSLVLPALALSAALAGSVPAAAISRYQATAMSCAEINARIDAEGAAIMRWQSRRNPSLPRYDRYVAHDGFCPRGQEAVRAHIPSADIASCPVKRCKQIERERWRDRRWLWLHGRD